MNALTIIDHLQNKPLDNGPLGAFTIEKIISLKELQKHFPDRISSNIKLNGMFYTQLFNCLIVPPYGVIAWSDGIILEESIKNMDFADAAQSILLLGEEGHNQVNHHQHVLSLTTGPNDQERTTWCNDVRPYIEILSNEIIPLDIFAPTQFAHVADFLKTHCPPLGAIFNAEERIMLAKSLWLLPVVQ